MGLVIDRRKGQRLLIGSCEIEVDRDCKIHVTGPRNVLVLRSEDVGTEKAEHLAELSKNGDG